MKTHIGKRVKTHVTGLKKSSARNFIEIEFPKIEYKYKLYSRMFTLVHDPSRIRLDDAWGWVFFDIEKIKKILTKDRMLFSIFTVEVHSGGTSDKEKMLEGYPHIHLVVYKASQGRLETFNEIHSLLRTETSFGKTGEDIRLDGETKKKGRSLDKSNISFLCYSLKNSKHEEPHNRLRCAYEKYKDRMKDMDVTLDTCLFFDNSDDKEIISFFQELNNKNLMINIPPHKLEITETKEAPITGFHGGNGTKKMTPGEEKFNNCFVMILESMINKGYRLCKDKVYIRKKNTRRTWEHWGTMENVVGELFDKDNFNTGMVYQLIKNKQNLVELALDEKQKMIPKIDINWFFIEFKDFYLHIPSYSIIRGEIPDTVACGISNAGISYNDLGKDINPKIWLSVIHNQPFGKTIPLLDGFCSAYYSVFLPLIQKGKVLCLYGVANSGKSSAIEPIKRTFPKEAQTEITSGQFSYSSLPGKRILGLDDVSTKILDAPNVKQLLEGGRDLMIEAKFENAKMDRFEGNIVICANKDGLPETWYEVSKEGINEFVLKSEFEVRLAIYRFETEIKNPEPGYLKRIEEEEIGKVILYCGDKFAKTILRRENNRLKQFDTYDECYSYIQNAEFPYRSLK